jgi:hypothetical protein
VETAQISLKFLALSQRCKQSGKAGEDENSIFYRFEFFNQHRNFPGNYNKRSLAVPKCL